MIHRKQFVQRSAAIRFSARNLDVEQRSNKRMLDVSGAPSRRNMAILARGCSA
jgi:hypothetical protein